MVYFEIMTSEERRLARYNRRQVKRNHDIVKYDDCFTFSHLWHSARKCYKGVGWKTSVKNFKRRAFSNVTHSYFVMKDRKHKPEKPHKFTIHNRGKDREVEGLTIGERVIQKCFCDYGLVDNVSKSLIYDNYATLKGKGSWLCLKRLKKRYGEFMKKHKENGYILIMDFHNYFYSIDHKRLYSMIKKYMDDDSFVFYESIVDNMKGLNLGSQLSQISAVYFSYMFDETCQRETVYYGRYMDDSYCMFKSKDELKRALPRIMNAIKELGLEINPKKVKIIKAKSGFTFLKKAIRYEDNKVIMYPRREFDRVIMRKIKKVNEKVGKEMLICYRPFYIKLNGYKRYLELERETRLWNESISMKSEMVM